MTPAAGRTAAPAPTAAPSGTGRPTAASTPAPRSPVAAVAAGRSLRGDDGGSAGSSVPAPGTAPWSTLRARAGHGHEDRPHRRSRLPRSGAGRALAGGGATAPSPERGATPAPVASGTTCRPRAARRPPAPAGDRAAGDTTPHSHPRARPHDAGGDRTTAGPPPPAAPPPPAPSQRRRTPPRPATPRHRAGARSAAQQAPRRHGRRTGRHHHPAPGRRSYETTRHDAVSPTASSVRRRSAAPARPSRAAGAVPGRHLTPAPPPGGVFRPGRG
ncbi:hypothetical protein HBB16_17095 [Pseudonocardia sp. MCCB 268]|nr:hypothetical protein [Pseudonocardia cytotoxica]